MSWIPNGVIMLAVTALAFSGCVESDLEGCRSYQSYHDQAAVCNMRDSFAYSKQTSFDQGSETFDWRNSHSTAQVSFGGQMSAGSAKIVIRDAAGLKVFEKTVMGPSQEGSFEGTQSGSAGLWKITISFTAASGQFGIFVSSRGDLRESGN